MRLRGFLVIAALICIVLVVPVKANNFTIQNITSNLFEVSKAGDFYLHPLTNCNTLDTDGNGLLSCGTDADTVWSLTGDYIYNNSGSLDFNESKLSTIYYNATSSQAVAGTIDGGTLAETQHPDGSYDGLTFNFTEASGSPGLDLRINFTGIDDFNRGVMRYKTGSLAGDYPIVQMWDYDNSVWEDYPPVGESNTFATMTQPVFDSSDHVQDGVAQMRIYKSSNGNTNNHYYVDWIAISKGLGTPSGQEVDPYSIHRDGNTPLTANWNAGLYTITANEFIGNVSCKNITGVTSDLCTLTDTDTTYSHLSNFTDDIGVSSDWDEIGDVPTATPSNGDTTHLSTADQIYDWVIGLGYSTTTYVNTIVASVGNWTADKGDYSTTAQANNLYAPINYGDEWNKTYADTLYAGYNYNPFNQVLNTTSNVQFNDATVNSIILDGDASNHKIYDNESCIIMQAGTTYLEVCE